VKKSVTDSSSACSDISQSPIYKGIRTPALQQSGTKVKHVTTRPPNPPPLKIVATRSEICSLKFGNLPPCELEGGGGGHVLWRNYWRGLPNVTVCDRDGRGQVCCKMAWRNSWMAPKRMDNMHAREKVRWRVSLWIPRKRVIKKFRLLPAGIKQKQLLFMNKNWTFSA